MRVFFSVFFGVLFIKSTFAQSPQSIPYQMVIRDAAGTVLANTSTSVTFTIHDLSVDGVILYEETHATSSNSNGLVVVNVGVGNILTGNFNSIDWGSGAKYLQVSMNNGNGSVDLGTQQMMAVPYTLFADDVSSRVSATGDSLFVGSQFVIVPGISGANPVSLSNYGAILLPGNSTCESGFISVTGCGNQDSLLYFNQYYTLVEIGGQCWFAENLATTQFNDGSSIPNITTGASWGALTTPAYCWYNNNASLVQSYLGGKMGALYNAYAVETNNICPSGWHVPSDCEWMYLENNLGLSIGDQELVAWRGTSVNLGGKMKSSNWTSPNLGANNSSGFSGIPSGNRMGTASASFSGINNYAYWWTSTALDMNNYWCRTAAYSLSSFERATIAKRAGYSIRCIKD